MKTIRPQRRCRRRCSGATIVEFALIAPIFFAMVIGLFGAVTYVFEVQVANDAAQAAARWGIASANFVGNVNQCQGQPPPSGMVSAATAAAGPLAGSLQVTTGAPANFTPSIDGGISTDYCYVQVQVPFVGFGGLFNLGPRHITANAVDYIS